VHTLRRGLLGVLTSVVIFATCSIASPTQVNPLDANPIDYEETPPAIESVHQHFLVKLKDATAGIDALQDVAVRTNVVFEAAREITTGLFMLQVLPNGGENIAQTLARLRADANVEFANPDGWRFPTALPNDPLFAEQWYQQEHQPAGTDVVTAWETTTGRSDIVIAYLDTGVRFDHPDLLMASAGGRLLSGYDFVSNPAVANDGDGRDSDPSDPGDWVSSADAQTTQFSGCELTNSTWHGTRVAGILGALSNNGIGITGMTWGPHILPVRVLGKCGGLDSDILDGMRWAAGLHVNGVPDNIHPAHIINVSLGGEGVCGQAEQIVINEVIATGATIIVAAGNDGTTVDSPADCAGVAAVAAVRNTGTKDYFSNIGSTVALSAPGGNCISSTGPCTYTLDTTINGGTTTPGLNGYTSQSYPNLGTSFSAPIVSGIAALMMSVNANLSSVQVIARLKEGAKAFPAASGSSLPTCHVPASSSDVQNFECTCTPQTCGAGLANALGALTAALRPIAAIRIPANIAPGQNVSLSGAASGAACNRSITSYAWTNVSDPNNAIQGADSSTAIIVAPASGSVTLKLTVTDDAGRTDSATVAVNSSSATTPAPATANTGTCVLPDVSISPTSSSVQVGGSAQTFEAQVNSATDSAVAWYVNKVPGGDSKNGTISTSGVYTPPAAVPSPNVVTITAVWTSDTTKYATAQVTVNAPVSISVTPVVANVAVGGTETFTAAVTNSASTAVNWSVNGVVGGNSTVGTISNAGVYTAPVAVPTPAAVTITAVSAVDSTRSAAAMTTVTVASSSSGGSSASGAGNGSSSGGGPMDPLTLLGCSLVAGFVAHRRHLASRLRPGTRKGGC
jgi:serine protease